MQFTFIDLIAIILLSGILLWAIGNIVHFIVLLLTVFSAIRDKIVAKKRKQTEKKQYLQIVKRMERGDIDEYEHKLRGDESPEVLGLLGHKWQKKYPNSNIYPFEHAELDELEYDENMSSLGEDIEFIELKNNQKQIGYE